MLEEQESQPEAEAEDQADDQADYDRRIHLERHSSSTTSENVNITIDESRNIPFSLVTSLFAAKSSPSPSNSNTGENTCTADTSVESRINLENLLSITEAGDAVKVLKIALESRDVSYIQSALDLLTHLCELDETKRMSGSLGKWGACSLIDQVLGTYASCSPLCEAAFRALCSLLNPPLTSSPTSGASPSVHPPSRTSVGIEEKLSNNRRAMSNSGPLYRMIQALQQHLGDEGVLEWGLRVIYCLTLEPGKYC